MNIDFQDTCQGVEPMLEFSFLLKTYELGAVEDDDSIPIWDVGDALGIDEPLSESIASDLQERKLIYYSSLAGDIALTSLGVSEIVLARSMPDQPTTHFPPLSSMSDQLMLPLPQLHSSLPTELGELTTQLEKFRAELTGDDSALELDTCIEVLSSSLTRQPEAAAEFISDLEDLQATLTS